jgi:hypothetical protein
MDTYTPLRFEHRKENVPDELKVGERWVCCDEEKVPLVATTSGAVYAASSTDPDTWRDYETALTAWRENEWSFTGIGRVIGVDEEYVGVDLDKCLDPESGELSPWATEILNRLDSYSEVSPSGTGVKVWVRARALERAHVKPGLEVYPRGRYFTVTGLVVRDKVIAERDEELAAIIAEEFPQVDRDRTPYDGPHRVLDLLDYLEKANIAIFAERSDGTAERVYSIRCPWAEEHTVNPDGGTRVGQYSDGATFFRCEHAHCRAVREWRQFRSELDPIVHLGRGRRAKGRLR